MKNALSNTVESARAGVLLLDAQRKLIAEGTRWVIGGTNSAPPLTPGATNVFHFVITSDKPSTTTNLTVKVTFTRLVLEGGKPGNPARDVQINYSTK